MTAVHRVISELWDDDPPETFAAARRLFSDGLDRHDVIHALAETEFIGAAMSSAAPPPAIGM